MILAADWDARELRLIHAGMKKGMVRIDRMLAVDIPEDVDAFDPSSLGGLLRKVLDQQKLRTERVLLDVPRDQALLTTLQLPAASTEELAAMVEFQIAKELPFPLSEAVVDFAAPESGGGTGPLPVLVGTVRKEVVSYYQKTCEKAGLRLERLGFRPFAHKVAVNELLGAGRYRTVVFVEVGPRLTEIDVITDGKLVFSRAASVAVPKESEPEDETEVSDEEGSSIIRFPRSTGSGAERVVQSLLVEITRSFEAYRAGDPQTSIDMVVVAGNLGVEARLSEALHKRFGAPVTLYNPEQQLDCPEPPGEAVRGFSGALGLVIGHASPARLQFDFLHPKKPVTTAERRLRKAPAVAAAVVLFVAAAIVYYFMAVRPDRIALAEARDKIHDAKATLKKLDTLEDTIEEAESFEKKQVIWLDELARLQTLLPDNRQMVLEQIHMDQRDASLTFPLECTERQVTLDAVQRIGNYRQGKVADPYYYAKAGPLTDKTRGQKYPVRGSIEVTVLDKVPEK
jgi:type IV pilus assembly protein PilM